ncbi:MAG: nitrate ABC transporter permease [Burkholderiales bacterium]
MMSVITLPAPSPQAAPKSEAKRLSRRSLNAAHPSAESLTDLRTRKEAVSSAGRVRTPAPAWLVEPTAWILGIAIFLAFWAVVAKFRPELPGPIKVWDAALKVFANPFYVNGPNDQGIGWNVLSSLKRVAIGFALAACVGIPLGFLIGRFAYLSNMIAPIISLLRPVSPLAWLPIGLLVFKKADPAATWTIFICSIWPMILNTAAGVRQVPRDYLNVARVLDLSEWKIFTKILFPAALPHVLTGVRLSIGVAWLVIVAAEMLTGGIGIGFWVWDEWNNLKVEHIIIAILVIGMVGLLLEYLLIVIARRFSYGEIH